MKRDLYGLAVAVCSLVVLAHIVLAHGARAAEKTVFNADAAATLAHSPLQTPAVLSAAAKEPSRKNANSSVAVSSSREKFIYLDDGSDTDAASGGNKTPNRTASPRSVPPLFIEADRQAVAPELFISRRSLRPRLSVEPQPFTAANPIRPDSFSAAAEQRSGFQIGFPLIAAEPGTNRGLGVWLSSEAARQAPNVGGRWYGQGVALDPVIKHQSYNVGVNIGYSGFTFGASLTREQNGLNLGYQGFDLGVGYYGQSWFTNIQVAGYKNDRNPLFHNFMGDRMQGIEVGAGYALWPGLTFSGRFKYFDYTNPFFAGHANDQERVFSLDTKFNF